MTKWVIKNPTPMALAMYGIVYLLVQMCIFWVFVVGNYEYIHKEAVWQTALVRTLTNWFAFSHNFNSFT